jgi:hypothetical protein
MVDREKVIQGLEHCGQPMECDGCPYDTEVGNCFTNLKTDAKKLLKKQPQWISVEDKRLNTDERYLVAFTPEICAQVMEVYIDNYGQVWRGNVQIDGECITHWMPLPEPPKEDKRDEERAADD